MFLATTVTANLPGSLVAAGYQRHWTCSNSNTSFDIAPRLTQTAAETEVVAGPAFTKTVSVQLRLQWGAVLRNGSVVLDAVQPRKSQDPTIR